MYGELLLVKNKMRTKKINILVLGVGGNVSQGILRALAISKLKYKLVGACVSDESLGLYLCDIAYISPYASDEHFLDWLVKTCNYEEIDIILTGVEEVILRLATEKERIHNETNAIFISSDLNTLEIGMDKLKTCEWLMQNKCAFPAFASCDNVSDINKLVSTCGYPLISKPRKGKGSNGILIINNEDELELIHKLKHYVVQQYIGNENSEYTVACYCDNKGNLVELIIMKRVLKNGTTVKAEVEQNEIIRKEAVKICQALKPRGPLNIQMRLDKKGAPVCFELNIRFSGTASMRARFGFNDVEALIRENVLYENVISFFNVTDGIAFRYCTEMFVDSEGMSKLYVSKKGVKMNHENNFIDGYRGK